MRWASLPEGERALPARATASDLYEIVIAQYQHVFARQAPILVHEGCAAQVGLGRTMTLVERNVNARVAIEMPLSASRTTGQTPPAGATPNPPHVGQSTLPEPDSPGDWEPDALSGKVAQPHSSLIA